MCARLLLLTYHGVHSTYDPSKNDPIYSIYRRDFLNQLNFLKSLPHIEITTLTDVRKRKQGSLVVLTFDDGLVCAKELIWPLLQKLRIRATFFISPGLIGKKGYLDWVSVRQMASEGAEFGTHGLKHRLFSRLNRKELEGEIVDSKKELGNQLGQKIISLASPGGSLHPQGAEIARKAGYRYFCTSRRSLNPLPAPFLLGRFPVKRMTPWRFFKSTVFMNKTALSLHRLIDEGKILSRRLSPQIFSRLRERIKR